MVTIIYLLLWLLQLLWLHHQLILQLQKNLHEQCIYICYDVYARKKFNGCYFSCLDVAEVVVSSNYGFKYLLVTIVTIINSW